MFFIGDEQYNSSYDLNENNETALIIVDMQNDFANPNGALFVPGGDILTTIIIELIKKYKTVIFSKDYHPKDHCSFHDNIYKTDLSNDTLSLYPNQNINQIRNSIPLFGKVILENGLEQILWTRHCVENTWGSQLIPQLKPKENNFIVYKGGNSKIDSYSAFFDNGKRNETTLHNYLKSNNIKKVDIVGLAFDYCVGYTALDAKSLGYETSVIMNATKSVCDSSKNFMEQKLIASGIKLIL